MSLEKFIIDFNSLLKEIKSVLDLKTEPLFNFKDIHVLSSIEISQKSQQGFSLPFKLIENTFVLAKDRVFKTENISFLPLHENFIVVPVKLIIHKPQPVEKELFLLFPACFEIEDTHRNSFANCIFEYAFNVFEQSHDIESKVSAYNILISFEKLVPNIALSTMGREWLELMNDPMGLIEYVTGKSVKTYHAREAFKRINSESIGAIYLDHGTIILLSNDTSDRRILLAIDLNLDLLEFYPYDLFSKDIEWINDLSNPSIKLLRSLEALIENNSKQDLRICDAGIFLPDYLELNFLYIQTMVYEGGLDPYVINNVEIWDFINKGDRANEVLLKKLTDRSIKVLSLRDRILKLIKSIFR